MSLVGADPGIVTGPGDVCPALKNGHCKVARSRPKKIAAMTDA